MTDQQLQDLTTKWQARLADNPFIACDKIEKAFPGASHPFCIGAGHVSYASNHGGYLTEDVIKRSGFPCCTCKRPIDHPDHKPMISLYVQVKQPCTQKDVTGVLVPVKEEMEADGIDGFAFPNYQLITDWGKKTA